MARCHWHELCFIPAPRSLSNTNSGQILRRHMVFNMQHKAKESLQYGWTTTSFSMLWEVSAWSPECKMYHPKCTKVTQTRLDSQSYWSMSTGKTWFMALLLWFQCVLFIQVPSAQGLMLSTLVSNCITHSDKQKFLQHPSSICFSTPRTPCEPRLGAAPDHKCWASLLSSEPFCNAICWQQEGGTAPHPCCLYAA